MTSIRSRAYCLGAMRAAQPRRGVAMLLVLISLMMATVLTSAYLSSRDNSMMIGENVSSAASARWGAVAALDMGVAVMQTESDWRGDHDNGTILDGITLAQAELGVTLNDLETGSVPGADTTYVELLASATAGGIEHDAAATLLVPVADLASVDLAEFALFAHEDIQMDDSSRLTRWNDAPLSVLERPLAIGTRSTSFGAVTVRQNALATDAQAWLPPGATGTTINNASELDIHAMMMDDTINFPAPPDHNVDEDGEWTEGPRLLGFLIGDEFDHFQNRRNVGNERRYAEMDLRSSLNITFQNNGVLAIQDDFVLRQGTTLTVSGDAVIVVLDDLIFERNASIEVQDGSRLTIFVRDDIHMPRRAYIGAAGGGPNGNGQAHADARRVTIFSIDDSESPHFQISGSSMIKGSIYAPHTEVHLSNGGTLCGRIAAKRIQLDDDATVVYDHALDRRAGYTNENSRLYDDDKRVKPRFLTLASLNPSDLQSLASVESVRIRADGRTYGTQQDANSIVDATTASLRPVAITTENLLVDVNLAEWEKQLP